jgi:hypothetical protein
MKCARDGGDEALDPLFVPHPAALKIGQLKDAARAVVEQLVQVKKDWSETTIRPFTASLAQLVRSAAARLSKQFSFGGAMR